MDDLIKVRTSAVNSFVSVLNKCRTASAKLDNGETHSAPLFLWEVVRRLNQGEVVFDIPLGPEDGLYTDEQEDLKSDLLKACNDVSEAAGWFNILSARTGAFIGLDDLANWDMSDDMLYFILADEMWAPEDDKVFMDFFKNKVLMYLIISPQAENVVLRVDATLYHQDRGVFVQNNSLGQEIAALQIKRAQTFAI